MSVGLLCALLIGASDIPINRRWDQLVVPENVVDYRALFVQASRRLGRRAVYIDAVRIDGRRLARLARRKPKEPFVRVVREALRRPFDLQDLLYFLDDVLEARSSAPDLKIWLPASRARKAGIFVHPDDVFGGAPRRYGAKQSRLQVDKPQPISRGPPAKDGALLGPRWCGRYKNPSGVKRKLRALRKRNPSGSFAARVERLMRQLKRQGATVLLYSTVRDRRRGYLIWGAYSLSRLDNAEAVDQQIRLLEELNKTWKLRVPIRWRHPLGWEKTVRQARRMADSYRVAFATRAGAERSSHYDGMAVDLNVFGLPRSLLLRAPDGARRRFDLSGANQTRDLSLTPALIDWIEVHFQMRKLKEDYPHWEDAATSAP